MKCGWRDELRTTLDGRRSLPTSPLPSLDTDRWMSVCAVEDRIPIALRRCCLTSPTRRSIWQNWVRYEWIAGLMRIAYVVGRIL